MRPIRLLLAIACSMPLATGAVHESLNEDATVTPVEYPTLLGSPEQFLNSQVRFRCTFAQVASLFDPLTTAFNPIQYRNFVVWGYRASLWEPESRGKPLASLYVAKDLPADQVLSGLSKYQIIDVIGRVVQLSDGTPWIDVYKVVPVEMAGAFTDNAIYHVQQGLALAGDGLHDLADEHFAAAQSENLPVYAAVAVRHMHARELASAGHNREAIALLQAALDIASQDPGIEPVHIAEIHALLAKVLNDASEGAGTQQRQELLTSSVEHAQRALDLDPTLADAYAVLGISLAGLGQFEEARRECDNALRLRQNDAEVRRYLGRILDQQGKYDEAIDALKRAIDLTPKDANIHKAVANAYYHRGLKGGPTAAVDLKTALREDDIALRLKPDDPETYYSSGKVLLAAADLGADVPVSGGGTQPATRDMAIERFRSAINADENFAPAHTALADLLRQDNKTDEALSQYEHVVDIQPDDFPSVAALAGFMLSINKIENAQLLYEQYLTRHPNNPQVRIELAHIYTKTGNGVRIAQLLAQLEEQVNKAPKSAAPLIALAEFRLAGGDPTAAVDLSTRALSLASDHQSRVGAAATLGKARWELGDVKGTLAILAPIMDQLVDEAALLDLGWAFAASKKPADARAVGDKLRTTEIATARSQEFIGWSFYLSGDFPMAEQLLKRASFANVSVRGYRLGMAMYRQGTSRYGEARPYLLLGSNVQGPATLFADAHSEVADALQAINASQASTPAASAEPPPAPAAQPAPAPSDSTATPAPEAAPVSPPQPAPIAAPEPLPATDPVAAGMARWAQDDVKGTIELLGPLGDKIDNEQALLALAWAYVADNRLTDATTVAARLKSLPTKTGDQDELQGWVLYLSGDYRGAEEVLKKATFRDAMLKAYRVGMALFMQGQPRYVEARALLSAGKYVTGRKSLLGSARSDADQALQAINSAGH
jgi:tetratricopeptide (TPR) repeat protein